MEWFSVILSGVIGFVVGYYFKAAMRIKRAVIGEGQTESEW